MITLGFRLAGWTNILGVLVFSLALTNERLIALSPVVFSRFGLISIMLWGAAYLAVATRFSTVPALVAVFAFEKMIYVITWVEWIYAHGADLPGLFGESALTAAFYAVYGPIDLGFGLLFAYSALRSWRTPPPRLN